MQRKQMYHDIDVLVVEKKTTDYEHQRTHKILNDCLHLLGISHDIVTFDEFRVQKTEYFDPKIKPNIIAPKYKFVIALGGDGTLLHTSHYIGGDVRLLGINSAPSTSKGYLCALKPDDISKKLETIIFDPTISKHINRLQIISPTKSELLEHGSFGHKIPLCLNDVLICHAHPAATTRTQLSLFDQIQNKLEFSENIYSSGIWVSTVSGQTAAISSYDFEKADEESDIVFVAIREPYFRKNEKEYPQTFFFKSSEKKLSITSKMPSGLICVDGHESCAFFEMGDVIEFTMPKDGVLKLVL